MISTRVGNVGDGGLSSLVLNFTRLVGQRFELKPTWTIAEALAVGPYLGVSVTKFIDIAQQGMKKLLLLSSSEAFPSALAAFLISQVETKIPICWPIMVAQQELESQVDGAVSKRNGMANWHISSSTYRASACPCTTVNDPCLFGQLQAAFAYVHSARLKSIAS